ncbi:hypothetical protein [Sulfurimonas sp.]|uniref:hypothetical protein n=1 Tax=Sulfurimonas sp. TaxID=2022749 RepID=UPI00286E6F27|nr:hypothetical protein [Sulfurimonas sp.]
MALSEEDKLWIEKKRRDIEREERELKRRGIIPYTEDELEEIRAKKEEMREQAELTAEAMKKAGMFQRNNRRTSEYTEFDSIDYNPATGLPMFGGVDAAGNPFGCSDD